MRSQLSRFFSFLEQRLEWLALAGASLSMVGLYLQYDPALGMVVVLFSTLAFFYLASGVLVLLDRANVERVMRLTWFLGMWGLHNMYSSAGSGVVGDFRRESKVRVTRNRWRWIEK